MSDVLFIKNVSDWLAATESPDTALADAGASNDQQRGLAAAADCVGRLFTETIEVTIGLAALDPARRGERTVRDATVFHQLG